MDKLTGIEIVGIYTSLESLAIINFDLSTSCNIARNIKALSIPKAIIDERRDALVQEYIERDDDGNVVVDPETGNSTITNVQEFNKKVTEILNQAADVEIIKIKRSAFDDVKVSPADILPLLDYLED